MDTQRCDKLWRSLGSQFPAQSSEQHPETIQAAPPQNPNSLGLAPLAHSTHMIDGVPAAPAAPAAFPASSVANSPHTVSAGPDSSESPHTVEGFEFVFPAPATDLPLPFHPQPDTDEVPTVVHVEHADDAGSDSVPDVTFTPGDVSGVGSCNRMTRYLRRQGGEARVVTDQANANIARQNAIDADDAFLAPVHIPLQDTPLPDAPSGSETGTPVRPSTPLEVFSYLYPEEGNRQIAQELQGLRQRGQQRRGRGRPQRGSRARPLFTPAYSNWLRQWANNLLAMQPRPAVRRSVSTNAVAPTPPSTGELPAHVSELDPSHSEYNTFPQLPPQPATRIPHVHYGVISVSGESGDEDDEDDEDEDEEEEDAEEEEDQAGVEADTASTSRLGSSKAATRPAGELVGVITQRRVLPLSSNNPYKNAVSTDSSTVSVLTLSTSELAPNNPWHRPGSTSPAENEGTQSADSTSTTSVDASTPPTTPTESAHDILDTILNYDITLRYTFGSVFLFSCCISWLLGYGLRLILKHVLATMAAGALLAFNMLLFGLFFLVINYYQSNLPADRIAAIHNRLTDWVFLRHHELEVALDNSEVFVSEIRTQLFTHIQPIVVSTHENLVHIVGQAMVSALATAFEVNRELDELARQIPSHLDSMATLLSSMARSGWQFVTSYLCCLVHAGYRFILAFMITAALCTSYIIRINIWGYPSTSADDNRSGVWILTYFFSAFLFLICEVIAFEARQRRRRREWQAHAHNRQG